MTGNGSAYGRRYGRGSRGSGNGQLFTMFPKCCGMCVLPESFPVIRRTRHIIPVPINSHSKLKKSLNPNPSEDYTWEAILREATLLDATIWKTERGNLYLENDVWEEM